MSGYVALILAAGLSSRMHLGYKPLLPIPYFDGQRNSLENLAQLYGQAGIHRVLVVGGNCEKTALAAEAKRLGLDYAYNPYAERGMFSSVQVGLAALGSFGAACFIHPADIPLVRPFVVQALLAEAQIHANDILIPFFKQKEGHPPLLPAVHLPTILAWTGEHGLRGAIQGLPMRPVPVADRGVLMDMDTDDDYTEVCQRALRRHILEPEEADELLCLFNDKLGGNAGGLAHARAVGRVAGRFALACNVAGQLQSQYNPLDPLLAEAGGLLHDMCKGEAGHERAAGKKLREIGLPDMARLVEAHGDCFLADNARLTEAELICMADKYVYGQQPVTLQDRFGQKLELFQADAQACEAILLRLGRAKALEERLGREMGQCPFELAREELLNLQSAQ